MKMNPLAKEFCKDDPLFRWLDEKLGFAPSALALFMASVTFAALAVELYLVGTPLSQLVPIVSFQALVIFPLAIILYFAVPVFLARPFSGLEKNNSISDPFDAEGDAYEPFRRQMVKSMNHVAWRILALLVIAYYWYYRLFLNVPSDPSRLLPDEFRVWMRIVLLVLYSPLIYMGMVTIARLVLGLHRIGVFFNSFKIKINPMDPDGSGGLGFVGAMLITSALIATALGAGAAGLVYVNIAAGNHPLGRIEIIILGLLYLILTPLLFYSLMWSPHRAMLRAREDALKPLANEYERAFSQERQHRKIKADALKSKTDHLVEIKRQYELIHDSFPLWPLRVGSLRSLLATSVLPAVSTLLSSYITNLWKLLGELLKFKP